MRNILDQKSREEGDYIYNLNKALSEADPELAFQGFRQTRGGLDMNSGGVNLRGGDRMDLQSTAKSIALDCQSKFIPLDFIESFKNENNFAISKMANINVEKTVRENPNLITKVMPESEVSKGYDSTINDFEKILGVDVDLLGLKGVRAKNKKGDKLKDGFGDKRHVIRPPIGGGANKHVKDDSEDIIKNLDAMMAEYLKMKG